MFPRQQRLSRVIFPPVSEFGRRYSSPHLTAVFPETTKGYAVVVSKKVARLSVARHRIKRRILGALRTMSLPPAVIIFPRTSALDMNYGEMKEELTTLLSNRNC